MRCGVQDRWTGRYQHFKDLAFVDQLKLAGVQVDSFVEPGVPHSYNVILNDSPQTIRFKNLRDKAVKQMFESEL